MEKIKETIKKHDNILVIFIIILLTIGICFNITIKNNDELWNYQNICKMLNGYKIYNEEKLLKILKKVVIVIMICYILISISYFVSWVYNAIYCSKFYYTHPYFGGYFKNDEEYEKMQKITEYIKNQNKKVVIFSDEAALYMIPLKESNGAMDLPFIVNFGKDGEENMIKEISNMSNTLFLIRSNQEELHYQESVRINQYTYENLKCVGTIEEFSIYEK